MCIIVLKCSYNELEQMGFKHNFREPDNESYSYPEGYDYYSKNFTWKHGSGSIEVWVNDKKKQVYRTFAFYGPSELCNAARKEYDDFINELFEKHMIEEIEESDL